jgi:cysteine-rich repeat protein
MLALVSGVLAATLIGFSPTTFHEIKVTEVYPGSDAAPNAQYVVLQMYFAGQNLVGGKQVRVFDAEGTLVSTFTFPANVAIGTDQSKILIATTEAQAFFAPLPADLTMTAALPALGGKVCFFDPLGLGDIDCAAWGGYSGSSTGVGTPENAPVGLARGTAMRRRLDICLSPTNLDFCDDTEDSANDFVSSVTPAPRNNAGQNGVIPPSTCGNSVVQSLEQCDDGNVANGDGCSLTCFREAGAFTPQALAVDPVASGSSDGNGVLEPGEQAAMRPSWRNAASAPLALTAALSTFAGPAAAAHTIVDGTAGYGTLAPAATASCTATGDCYALSVSNPPTRPLTHWDATSAEVNVNYGFKTWSVHVGASFDDVARANPFYRFIETLLHRGVTGGCSPTAYCPGGSTTREAMAVFVLLAKDPATSPPACGTPLFADVPASSPFCRWIEELARRGVVGGCGGPNYCPTAPAPREAMSVFVLRTLDPTLNPPACGTPVFTDVPASSPFCRWIEELARRGVVSGCGGGNYCPTAAVSRDQMGVFLTVTFGLTLYGL